MKAVIVACTDDREAQKISELIPKDYKVAIIEASNRLGVLLNVSAMVIVDHGYYEQYGLQFFRNLLKNPHPPFLILIPLDDIQTIVDITELGMRPIPKVPDYQKLLRLAANNILNQVNEQDQLQQRVLKLKQRIEELEKAASEESSRPIRKVSSKAQPHDVKDSVLDEIIFVFKRGEIELPTLPQMGIKFQEMMNKGANLHNIGKFLKQDMAISSKLISVSNSTYYRGVTESKDLGQAISRLGLKNTKRYVDTICNRSLYATKNKRFLKFLESLWDHSLACAYASQAIDESLALDLKGDAFTMGLLHDIGKLLLLQVLGDLQLQKKIGDQVEDSELLDTVNTHHAKFGAALLKKWNFSETFSIIASYHNNLEAAASISNELLVVHFGNLMVKSMGFALDDKEDARQPEIDLEDTESARRLGLDASMIDEFKNKVSALMEELKGLFT